MIEQQDLLTTLKRLMRLTRKGIIDWKEPKPAHENALPSFEGQYNDLVFRLEDVISPLLQVITCAACRTFNPCLISSIA